MNLSLSQLLQLTLTLSNLYRQMRDGVVAKADPTDADTHAVLTDAQLIAALGMEADAATRYIDGLLAKRTT